MKVGIIGTKHSGKSTLFSILTENPYPSQEVGVWKLKDERVDYLAKIVNSKKKRYAEIQVIDTKFNPEENIPLPKVDGFIYIIPGFKEFEVEKELEKMKKNSIQYDQRICEKLLSKENIKEEVRKVLEKINTLLQKGIGIYEGNILLEEFKLISGFGFLTSKPTVVVVNSEKKEEKIKVKNEEWVNVNAKLEKELIEIEEKERKEYRKEFGIKQEFSERFSKIVNEGLGFITFFTIVGKETRAWLLKKGEKVIEGAGKIHSDIKEGFIRAEVMEFKDFKEAGKWEKGKVKIVTKEYEVCDGDIIEFKFKK